MHKRAKWRVHGVLVMLAVLCLPATQAWSAWRHEAEDAIAAAEAARAKAAAVGGEWRDTAKLINKAQELLETRQYTNAIKLADQAKLQGDVGYEQALAGRNADFPDYMRVGLKTERATLPAAAEITATLDNLIAPELASVEVMHDGESIVIRRGHDKEASLPAEFTKTDRGCPPFCVQPVKVAAGVDTVGELEVLSYLEQAAQGDSSILVVDSRTSDWVTRGTIPGSVNIPWTLISKDAGGTFVDPLDDDVLADILTDRFGAVYTPHGWDFTTAKTLVLFCNGIWCSQSSENIDTLLELGYPPEKLKWYRGGVQDWVSVGLTTVRP